MSTSLFHRYFVTMHHAEYQVNSIRTINDTSTSEITAVHARVRVHNIIMIHTHLSEYRYRDLQLHNKTISQLSMARARENHYQVLQNHQTQNYFSKLHHMLTRKPTQVLTYLVVLITM